MNHTCLCHIRNLQTVVQPVRTEEHAVVHLPMLTVTVPVGTQETTARTEVCTCANTINEGIYSIQTPFGACKHP